MSYTQTQEEEKHQTSISELWDKMDIKDQIKYANQQAKLMNKHFKYLTDTEIIPKESTDKTVDYIDKNRVLLEAMHMEQKVAWLKGMARMFKINVE